MSQQVVIVGAGHAGGHTAAVLKQKGYPGRIVLVGDESWLPYQRPPLSKKFLAGELPADRLYVKPAAFFDDPAFEVRLDTLVTAIDRHRRLVTTAAGEELPYEALVLATGSRVRRLEAPGSELAGIHYLRNIDDVDAVRRELDDAARVVIVGAGYIGLEVAAVARQAGKDVTVIELADRVMSRVVSPEVSAFYAAEHRNAGVELRLNTGLRGFVGDGGRVSGVETADGDVVPADLVVVGVGILPNTELAAAAGLATDDGIVVDEYCRSEDPHIYAIGDCTAHPSRVYSRQLRLESVQNALEQGRVAATNIAGGNETYDEVPWFWSDQYDLKLQIAGLSTGYDQAIVRGDPGTRAFSCAYLGNGRLLAIDAVNAPRDFVQAKALIAAGATPDPTRLADPSIQLKDV
jgi:3-phenylpropionate/trans-cinnamate dioxygenase ferredoxin reductase subunit